MLTMKTTSAALAAALFTSASLMVLVGGSTALAASHAGAKGHQASLSPPSTGLAVNGWGPHFERRTGFIPGAIGTPPPGAIKVPGSIEVSGTPEIVQCPCTLERDPLVNHPLFGGVPNDLFSNLKIGVGSVLEFRAGFAKRPLEEAGQSRATDAFNAMVTTWGLRFDPRDFPDVAAQAGGGHHEDRDDREALEDEP
jgi:hypothetical protein